jgi:hypothetical protein
VLIFLNTSPTTEVFDKHLSILQFIGIFVSLSMTCICLALSCAKYHWWNLYIDHCSPGSKDNDSHYIQVDSNRQGNADVSDPILCSYIEVPMTAMIKYLKNIWKTKYEMALCLITLCTRFISFVTVIISLHYYYTETHNFDMFRYEYN